VLVRLGTVLDQVLSNFHAICDELVLAQLLEGGVHDRGVRGVRRVLLQAVHAHQVQHVRLLRAAHARHLAGRAGRAVDLHDGSTRALARQLLGSGSGRQGLAAARACDAEFVREPLLLVLEFPILGTREAKTSAARAPRQAAEHVLEEREVPEHALTLEVTRLLLVGLHGWPVDQDRAPMRPYTRVHMGRWRKELSRRHGCRSRPRPRLTR
jgi:hypothetical protein